MTTRAKISKKKHDPAQTAFNRFMLIVAFFVLWIGAIGVRLVHLQVNESQWLRDKAQDQRRDELKTRLLRGTIYDRNERALAMSVKVKSLYADPREIEDVNQTAQRLAPILKLKANDIAANLQTGKDNNKRFVWLARRVDEDTVIKLNLALESPEIRKFDLPKFNGLHWREDQKRSYPYKNLAAQVVGFSNADDIGQAGIEQSQEEILRGAVVKKWQDRDRLGRVYEEEDVEEREPPKDIVLTINNSIQYKVEEALEKGVKASNSKSGMAIVVDPKTGEILAMANYPTFDPNRYTESAVENYQNKAIQSIYSPGSVFKLVTYSSAINEGLVNPNGMIDCRSGFIEVAGHRFNDPHATKVMSYGDALAVSSNVAAIKTGLSVGKEKFYGYARKFGFGQTVGIELPAEARGQFRAPEKWNGDSLASMSIGYEVGVTALQMVSAYSTIANDGVNVKPHVIKEIRNGDGKVFSRTEAEQTAVVSPETAHGFRQMLKQVVLKGTAKRAQLNGYTVAGKTGTAWKFNAKLKKVDAGKYVSSFIGMAPADNPAIVILVVMDEPSSGARDGGQVSAPVFKEIAEGILPEMNVAPDGRVAPNKMTAENVPTEVEPADAKMSPPEKDEDTDAAPKKFVEKKIKETADVKKPENDTGKKTKEEKPPEADKKSPKPKATDAEKEKPKSDAKNKSSADKVKKKT
ncbi:MAG: penicillin-binding transpeptidase domain-containing protein [Acidobacteriota bacterium]|nr:penicillin-binding transpeptidase domain-containing protein [Acidobacteriota bacterium]